MTKQEIENMERNFKESAGTNSDSPRNSFAQELELFLINSPLDSNKAKKAKEFIHRAYQIGRDSKL